MIHFFIGTKAQFIKMVPLMVELRKREVPFRYIDSGQHAGLTKTLRQTFGIPEPDVCFRTGEDITSIANAIIWSGKIMLLCLRGRDWLRKNVFPDGGICLIHGDTLTTLLGMKMAEKAGLHVGHIEAGLRSFCVWHPFPEELIRMYCMKRCDLLFAPSGEAENNLKSMNVRGRVINVGGNTVVDAIRLMQNVPVTVEVPKEDFALATCHRLETITSRKRLQKVVSLLNRVAERIKVVFVTHKPTRKYLEKFSLTGKLNPSIRVMDMLEYVNFVALLRSAKMVLTDGGSIQEECAYLNKSCLIMRMHTERPDGLGKNAMLWRFDDALADDFLSKTKSCISADAAHWPNPSAQIADALIALQDSRAAEQGNLDNSASQLACSVLKFIFRFGGSAKYWEKRYAAGGSSGKGSYGKLAQFKAEVLNSFVAKNNISSVIEFGCGDGHQLSLAEYPAYIGLDVSQTAVNMCKECFKNDNTKNFFLYKPEHFPQGASLKAELSLSLDVIYHLVEDRVFELYMKHLFGAAEKFVIIYSADCDAESHFHLPHIRQRRFSQWIQANLPQWRLLEKIPNRYPDDYFWRGGPPADFFIYAKL